MTVSEQFTQIMAQQDQSSWKEAGRELGVAENILTEIEEMNLSPDESMQKVLEAVEDKKPPDNMTEATRNIGN